MDRYSRSIQLLVGKICFTWNQRSLMKERSNSVNAHANELRCQFVAHEGKKELVVTTIGNRYTVNFGNMAVQMTNQLHDNVRLCLELLPRKTS
jgi:hypothetical protein